MGQKVSKIASKRCLVLVHDIFEDSELLYPVIRMQEEGIEVVIAGEEKRTYLGKHGYPSKSAITFKEMEAGEFDGVFIPGGFSPDKLRRVPEVLKLVQEMDQAEKMIAFICHGGWVPISAKILKGRAATGTVAIKDDLENAGAIWKDEPVVIDGNLISSRTPKDLPPFGKAIVEALT
ncbi:type 1 glutamine amidotransferase domain-containing protein [Candidatus Neptunochlamydia vexilliferae]|uniref:Intracellular protease 1 n=1 Tax=Candidatus Neptunichlamydia vexilliferae TaxID=1651774 RepID=A0ABS0AZ16_9BACT|nr:type 1 glutamine amidotransferase domain-containing protein [Candidatus Neptunochlamydia vexilliferae]MBF5059214.1 Intracellular protease 1 [Candidatus Neptunochlamydia vexilliferae]